MSIIFIGMMHFTVSELSVVNSSTCATAYMVHECSYKYIPIARVIVSANFAADYEVVQVMNVETKDLQLNLA